MMVDIDRRSPGAARYPTLFSPFRLGRLRLANRMMVPAMTTNFAEADGSVGEALIGYLVERARGGFGAIVTENIGVHPGGRVMARMVMADDDRYLPGLRRLAAEVKAAGGVLIGQLSHAGRQTRSKVTGSQLVAPSAIPCPLNREMPRALPLDEIAALETAFVDAACRLAAAGFDGVEIHGAHGYLVGGFLSAYSNKRTDTYGGSLDNRMRFLLRIVAGIQDRLGRDFPLLVRISAEEFVPDGLDLTQAVAIANRLAEAGVHGLSVSVGVYESFNKLSMITGEPEGQWLALAGRVKAATTLPVIGVGRIKRPQVAEAALAGGLIDIAAFGRASIADPALADKVARGAEDEVMWCLGCNVCLGRSSRPETICPVNPLVGRELSLRFEPAARPARVVVHGSSLSALTAAWAAAARGHAVTIVDAVPFGGMQAWRAQVPGQEEYREVLDAALRRAIAAGAELRLGGGEPEADAVWRVRRFAPVDRARIAATPGAVSSYEILSGARPVTTGMSVAVVGDDLSAAEAALCAAHAGARVSLHTSGRVIAVDAHPGYREITTRQLQALGGRVTQEAVAAADLIVIGHRPGIAEPQATDWEPPRGAATALLDDAYEPGLMTSAVYGALALALCFDSSAPG